jgi:hypothetical protein
VIPSVPVSVLVPVVVVSALVPLSGLDVVASGARERGVEHWLRLGTFAMLGLLVWGGTVVALDALELGWGSPYRYLPVVIVLAWALPQLGVVVVLRRVPPARAVLGSRHALFRLTTLQTARNLGVVFLILHAQHKVPGLFAYPAAWGDVVVGVLAPIVAGIVWFRYEELTRRGSRWRASFIAFNVFGVAEHVMAITLGGGAFPGVVQVFHTHPTTIAFSVLPLVLFPVYMVPFAEIAHLCSLQAIRLPVIASQRVPRHAAVLGDV